MNRRAPDTLVFDWAMLLLVVALIIFCIMMGQ
jgi:hypothetical protein